MIATLKRARGALLPNIDKQLSDALRQVRVLNDQFGSIRKELSKTMSWESFETKRQQATEEYAKSPTPENFEKLCMSEIILEKAQEKLAGSYRALHYGNATENEFARRCPQWREVLAKPVVLRLQLAKPSLSVSQPKKKRAWAKSLTRMKLCHTRCQFAALAMSLVVLNFV